MKLLMILIIVVIAVAIVLSATNKNQQIKKPSDKERLEQLNQNIKNDYYSYKGETEEKYIEKELLKLNFPKRVLRDLYIPYNNETAQADVVILTEFGIYVIESKNYSGWIFGSANNKTWTQSLNKNSKFKFYNPIWQNRTHIKALAQFLYLEEKYFSSLIVFNNKAELKKVPANIEKSAIIKDNEIINYFNYEKQKRSTIFNEEQLENIYNVLLPTTQVSDEIRKKQIENAKKHQQ